MLRCVQCAMCNVQCIFTLKLILILPTITWVLSTRMHTSHIASSPLLCPSNVSSSSSLHPSLRTPSCTPACIVLLWCVAVTPLINKNASGRHPRACVEDAGLDRSRETERRLRFYPLAWRFSQRSLTPGSSRLLHQENPFPILEDRPLNSLWSMPCRQETCSHW